MIAAVLCVVALASAHAEVELQSARWQRVVHAKNKPVAAVDITEASVLPGEPIKGRLLAKVSLLNRGQAVEGILLRYIVIAKIAPLAKPQTPAMWALPYMLEEKRVPKIGPNRIAEATLDPTALTALYLRKIYRMGYWPEELKLRVMLEPRTGVVGPIQIVESDLPFRK